MSETVIREVYTILTQPFNTLDTSSRLREMCGLSRGTTDISFFPHRSCNSSIILDPLPGSASFPLAEGLLQSR